MAWRYFAQRLTPDGPAEILDLELPLVDPTLTETLSGPSAISASIPLEFSRLKVGGRPLLAEWGAAIYAEADGQIRLGTILVRSQFADQEWSLECSGFTGYAQGLPYLDATFFVEEDPLNIVRHIWDYIQTKHSPLGMVLDGTTSPVRLGTELEQVEFDTQAGPVSFEAGPRKLAWFQTDDLGKEVDSYAKETPFDYTEEHSWNAGRTNIEHRMRLWYPRKGVRRPDLRFVLGENLFTPPSITSDGAEYANGVLGLGAGEGRDMIRSEVAYAATVDRLRRVAVVTDKSLRSQTSVNALARRELAMRLEAEEVSTVIVRNHPHADVTAIEVGDEIRIQAEGGWRDVDLWCRVLSRSIKPDSSDDVELSVIRADRAAV